MFHLVFNHVSSTKKLCIISIFALHWRETPIKYKEKLFALFISFVKYLNSFLVLWWHCFDTWDKKRIQKRALQIRSLNANSKKCQKWYQTLVRLLSWCSQSIDFHFWECSHLLTDVFLFFFTSFSQVIWISFRKLSTRVYKRQNE